MIDLPDRDNPLEAYINTKEIVPNPPSQLTNGGMVDGKIKIIWQKPITNTDGTPVDLFGFAIYKYNQTNNIEDTIYIGNTNIFLDTNVQPNSIYIYKVAAINSKGKLSEYSNTIQINYTTTNLKPGKIVGNIYSLDSDNDPLPIDIKVTIKIITDSDEKIDDIVFYPNEIGVDGYFEINDLLPGEYELQFYAQGYKVFNTTEKFGNKITVEEGKIKILSSDIVFEKIE